MSDSDRPWCAACNKFAPPEQDTGDCYYCGESCWSSVGAWVARQAGERLVGEISSLSHDERMEAVYTLSDALCLWCGANRPAPDELPCCKERGEWGARKAWISVADRLPPPNEGVITQLAGERRDRCLAYIVDKARIDIDNPNVGPWRILYVGPNWTLDGFTPEVTHWQAMPKATE